MILIVGLGNFGKQYINNRHNVGFLLVDYLQKDNNFPQFRSNFSNSITEKTLLEQKIILAKPETFINISGSAVHKLSNFYKIESTDIIIIQDDIDMDFAKLRYKTDSGSGGHNGIKDIHSHLGSSIHRIKIGVGKTHDVNKHVLSDFTNLEMQELQILFHYISLSIKYLVNKQFTDFTHKVTTDYAINKVVL